MDVLKLQLNLSVFTLIIYPFSETLFALFLETGSSASNAGQTTTTSTTQMGKFWLLLLKLLKQLH